MWIDIPIKALCAFVLLIIIFIAVLHLVYLHRFPQVCNIALLIILNAYHICVLSF